MSRIIVAMLALAFATLAGCGGLRTGGDKISSTVQSQSQRSVERAVVVAELGDVSSATTSPSSLLSLQPFKEFKKGEGEGVAREYKPRSKAQFVALLRDKGLAKKEMRVTCDVLVRQMAEGHKDLPFEGCEGAAAAIEGDNGFVAVACQDEMFLRHNWLAVTNEKGSAFGVWHRKCLKGEQVLVYKGQPIISLTCLNVAIPVSRPIPAPLPKPAVAARACPNVYFLKVNVWEHKALKLPGVEQTHAKEELGQNQFAGVPHVSKTHGAQLRRAYAAGELRRSEAVHAFQVSLIMTPESQGGASTITAEEVLSDVSVTAGLYDALQFTRAQLDKWDAIRLVAINDNLKSPPRYRSTGVQELRFFNRLPGKRLGEWDNNPDPDCIMNVHWIE